MSGGFGWVARAVATGVVAAGVLVAQSGAAVADVTITAGELERRADRSELDIAAVVAALAGDDAEAARTAAAIVRHEWLELPHELFDALDAEPLAARRLLEELALAPRPAARRWALARAEARRGRSVDDRLLALAASGEPLTRDGAQLLLESAQQVEVAPGDGFALAVACLPAAVADRMVGRLHAVLGGGAVAFERLAPLLDRLSPRGSEALLGLAVSLPAGIAEQLLDRVQQSRPELLGERVAFLLDGHAEIDTPWLAFAGPHLDRPARIERVLTILQDSRDAKRRRAALLALLAAGSVDERVLAAVAGDDEAMREVIWRAADAIGPAVVVELLQADPTVAQRMAGALARRRQLEPAIERQLLAVLDGIEVVDGGMAGAALVALVQAGSAAAVRQVWPWVRSNAGWPGLFERLGGRADPFVVELLRDGLAASVVVPAELDDAAQAAWSERIEEQRDLLRILLVARGEHERLGGVIDNLGRRDVVFVRRCRQHVTRLDEAEARQLFELALASHDAVFAGELLEWAVQRGPAVVTTWLWQVWQQPADEDGDDDELREVVMRLLATSSRREQLLVELGQRIDAGPLPDHLSSLPYEVLDGMPEPLHERDLALCARLLVDLPRSDPEGERRRVRRWPDGARGFPLVRAIARRLRQADVLAAQRAFDAVVEAALAAGDTESISRQRLEVFWRSLMAHPDLQRTLGTATVPMWRFGDEPTIGDGAAHLLLALRAERDGELLLAAQHADAAAHALLRRPRRREAVRWLLGDADFVAGVAPEAALSALPHRLRLAHAHRNGDSDAIRRHTACVREFAGRDRATLAILRTTSEESDR